MEEMKRILNGKDFNSVAPSATIVIVNVGTK